MSTWLTQITKISLFAIVLGFMSSAAQADFGRTVTETVYCNSNYNTSTQCAVGGTIRSVYTQADYSGGRCWGNNVTWYGNLLVVSNGCSGAFAVTYDVFAPPPPPPPQYITVIGNGTGGTTHGDKQAACRKAEDRAMDDARMQCDRYNGYLQDWNASGCDCKKKPGSADDYTCRVQVRAGCRR